MKRIFLIIVFLVPLNLFGQDLFNSYSDLTGQDYSTANWPPWYIGGSFNSSQGIFSTSYQGEYVLYANDLPWIASKLSGQAVNIDLTQFLLTYQVELVSFPFMPIEAFSYGHADGSTTRVLGVADDGNFIQGANYWEFGQSTVLGKKMHNKTPVLAFEHFGNDYISDQSAALTLVSTIYETPTNGGFDIQRIVIPHSILKHTISLHCGTNPTDQVISSFTFYIDLTRGIMREYPFISPNQTPTNATSHDITIKPKLFTQLPYTYDYDVLCNYGVAELNETCTDGTPNWKGDLINYTPFSVADPVNICNLIPSGSEVSSLSDISYDQNANTFNLPIPNNTVLYAYGPRNITAENQAGYDYNGIYLEKIEPNPIVHQYVIDNSVNLTNINFDEKVIYNPSEVTVTASNLHFPTNYTFKTIRAFYPYLNDVVNENTAKNGGPYVTNDPFDPNYLTNLNVTTDLFKDFHNVDPVYLDNDHSCASIYHLANGSKITVEPCVRIFDATFEVNTGSEIVFENWSTNQINVERYKLLQNGGTITRCNEDFLLQDDHDDKKILHYRAGNSLLAGENVDINKPSGK